MKHVFEYHMPATQLCGEWEKEITRLVNSKPADTSRQLRGLLKRLSTPKYPLDMLTIREWQVMKEILNGVSYKEGGQNLGISPKTFSVHKQAIKRKTGLSSQRDFVLFGIKHKLVKIPE